LDKSITETFNYFPQQPHSDNREDIEFDNTQHQQGACRAMEQHSKEKKTELWLFCK